MLSADNISTSIKKEICLHLKYIYELDIPFHANSEPNLFLIFCLLLFKQIGSAGPCPIFKNKYFFLLYSHFLKYAIITIIIITSWALVYARHYPENLTCANWIILHSNNRNYCNPFYRCRYWDTDRLNKSHKSSHIGVRTHAIWLQTRLFTTRLCSPAWCPPNYTAISKALSCASSHLILKTTHKVLFKLETPFYFFLVWRKYVVFYLAELLRICFFFSPDENSRFNRELFIDLI